LFVFPGIAGVRERQTSLVLVQGGEEMRDVAEIRGWRGRTVRDRDGDKIGSVEEIYVDDQTGKPEWLAIRTGLFGTRQSLVPVEGARDEGGDILVAYAKQQVQDSPNVDPDGEISQEEEQRLYGHYGLDYGESRSDSGLPEGGMAGENVDRTRDVGVTTGRGPVGEDVTGPETDEAMTRSEEELRVGTTRREAGRARLRKYIVSEPVEETVSTQREEARLEREPITDANIGQATSGPELSEQEHEVTLSSEEPVVEKRVVPKERVRLDKDVVSEQQSVSDEVRKEAIESDVPGDADVDRGPDPASR
jgi:uncharacterized protein (TIGR02271 family)